MQTVTIEVEDHFIPPGYEPVAIRSPKPGEFFTGSWGIVEECKEGSLRGTMLILRKKPPVYREPTEADIGATVQTCSMDGTKGNGTPRTLLAVLPEGQQFRFICQLGEDNHEGFRWARIEVPS